VWDSPTTRGLFDQRTGVYWAVDAFATPTTPNIEASVDELDPDFWRSGMAMFTHHAVAPWLHLVDDTRFAAHVDRVRDLDMTTIASAHGPLIPGTSIDTAFTLVRDLPHVATPPLPDQGVLDAILADLSAA
jgi:hypothetical protein